MEAALQRLEAEQKTPFVGIAESSNNDELDHALQRLAVALEGALPVLALSPSSYGESNAKQTQQEALTTKNKASVSAQWLLDLCATIPSSALDAKHLARAIWEASTLPDEASQQAALFDALGEAGLEILMEVAPRLAEIASQIDPSDLSKLTATSTTTHNETYVDVEHERRQLLYQEAVEASQLAAIAAAQLEDEGAAFGGATHTIQRSSDKQARKWAEKAARRAKQAFERAKEAGVILDEESLLQINPETMGDGGLMHRTRDEIWALQQSLLPARSKQYYDHRGLPHGAEHIQEDGMEKVVIPAARRDESDLPERLRIQSAIPDPELAKAFSGTTSLNPMQSAVFEAAFHKRENLLVCAPTGAGKTNVAMLTVTAHFRDVGLIDSRSSDGAIQILEAGKKVVYIAPMKALAQEVVGKFSSKLKALHLIVRELTGDMQLTRAEAESANVIVTTPEKWDVVTRKSGTDEMSLGNQCGLLIIDEVHLLADERGAVIESVVSRLHRVVESRQRMVRIVALSATLPNYQDVAEFLQVPSSGLFYFGPEHRPVPLQQQFIGVGTKRMNRNLREQKMDVVCFDVVIDSLQRGYQVMVFVHSRKGTGDTARALAELAIGAGVLERHFMTAGSEGPNGDAYRYYLPKVRKSRNREVGYHFDNGMGIHHAGMLRGDRKLTEQMFNDGAIKVLCCTATLAWGINLPAHTVVIKGTDVYSPDKGGNVDLSILDVQQIFGRAGRPQFDSSGEATLITTLDAFPRYMDKLVRPVPIESNFIGQLADHLNAEITGRTVTNIQEAATWLTYTYLYVRMQRNPLAYGISADEVVDDPRLRKRCLELVTNAARFLDSLKMVRFDPASGNLNATEVGRIAAHFYVQAESVETFNDMYALTPVPSDGDLCRLICSATEFRNMKIRQEEMEELQELSANACPIPIKGAGHDDVGRTLVTEPCDKAFVLLQTFISRAKIKSFTLVSDMNYIISSAARIARALFEMSLKEQKATSTRKLLRIAKSIEKQIWWFQTPLRHFDDELSAQVFASIEAQGGKAYDSFESALSLLEMQPNEVSQFCRAHKAGSKIQSFVSCLPRLDVSCIVHPVTKSVLRFEVKIQAAFKWVERYHGGAQSFWLFVEDPDANRIYHREYVTISFRNFKDSIALDMPIPVFDSIPPEYTVRLISDTWVAVEQMLPVPLIDINFPKHQSVNTPLLDLTPIPISALNDRKYEQLFTKFDAFNPIQTQLFHVLYHTNCPVFVGAPTGSGKTTIAELAILRMKRVNPKSICVYIAPLKALARERLKEWQQRLGSDPLNWKILELSGDTSHDRNALEQSDVLVCTPEKWDLVSRGWRGSADVLLKGEGSEEKEYIKRVSLLVIDEVHLLGEERGAVLEALVSRTRFISRLLQSKRDNNINDHNNEEEDKTRIIGLSTALANPVDLANWIGIDTESYGPARMRGLYNFQPSVRPVPVKVHLQGYAGRHYCPRMATMNKPCFAAIKELSPTKPVLIFVASRRQTRLTAFDIISYAASDENPKRFLGCDESYAEDMVQNISDEALRHTILFGIGLHHAGLSSKDRSIVEQMYLKGQIQILVATATLAWGVNLPAHLVIVKGTEYFDGKTSRYVDYPLTDVLQMVGRAGRPGFDTSAEAVVMVMEDKKDFYRKFLYTPFPVESCLKSRIREILNAEIAAGTVSGLVDAVGYMSWTFYARRVRANPSYYGANSDSEEDVEQALLHVVQEALSGLREQGCIVSVGVDEFDLRPSHLGIAASSYYLDHRSPKRMQFGVRETRKLIMAALEEESAAANDIGFENKELMRPKRVDEIGAAWLLYVLSTTNEFDELPVRHNEEILNEELSGELMWGPDAGGVLTGASAERYHSPEIYEDPHTKAFLLMQAYLEGARLPISDYVNDTKSVVDNIPRLLAAMKFIASDDKNTTGSFELLTQFTRTKQLIESRSTVQDDPLLQLPGFDASLLRRLRGAKEGSVDSITSLHDFRRLKRNKAKEILQQYSKGRSQLKKPVDQTLDALYAMPLILVKSCSVSSETEKASEHVIGRLKIDLEIERDIIETAHSLSILVGTARQRMLLAAVSVPITRKGTWSFSRDVTFDWNVASADGGEDGGVVVRFLIEEVRGLDTEQLVRLK